MVRKHRNRLLPHFSPSRYQDKNCLMGEEGIIHKIRHSTGYGVKTVNTAGLRLLSLERPVCPLLESGNLTGKQFPTLI